MSCQSLALESRAEVGGQLPQGQGQPGAPEAVSRGVDSSGNRGECGVEVGKTAEEAREEAPVAATVREDGAWTRGWDGEKGRDSGLLRSWCLSMGRGQRGVRDGLGFLVQAAEDTDSSAISQS